MRKLIAFTVAVAIFVSLPLSSFARYAGGNSRIEKLMPERDGLVFVRYSYNPKLGFRSAPNEKVSFHAVDMYGSYPIPLSEDIYMGVGLLFDLHHFRLHNVTNYIPGNSINAYNIGIPLDGFFLINEDWFVDVNFTPTLASDLEDVGSGHDFQFNGFVLAGWAFSDIASLMFGVAVGKDFWSYLPFPLLGIVVRPDDSFFNMEFMLPYYARFNFDLLNWVTFFVQGEFKGYVWDVTNRGTVPRHFMKMYDSHAGGGFNFKISDGINIDIWGGAVPYRKFHYRDRLGQAFTERQKVGWFVESKITVTPELFMNED